MNLSEKINEKIPSQTQKILRQASELASQTSNRLVIVGGVVRDLILNEPIVDVDLMADHPAQPFVEKMAAELSGTIKSHPKFLTFSILYGSGEKLDIATAREETYLQPAQLPTVTPGTIEKDLKRRDFTINAMACWLSQDKWANLEDPFGGLADIDKKKIRVLHGKSFIDDPTRLYRAARFSGRLGFEIESETQRLIDEAIGKKNLNLLTPTRKRHEFELILKEKNPVPALKLLEKWGALSSFHPDWALKEAHEVGLISPDSNEGKTSFHHRLGIWFKPWGKQAAETMMTSLEFERSTKKEVLAQI